MVAVGPVAVAFKPRHHQLPLRPRLDPQHKLRVHKPLPPIVQQHVVGMVPVLQIHARGHKDVGEAVGVEISRADPPRPIGLGVRLVRTIDKHTPRIPRQQRIPQDHVPRIHRPQVRGGHPVQRGLAAFLRQPLQILPHVHMHAGHQQVGQAVVVVIERLDPHPAPRDPRKVLARLPLETPPPLVLVIHVAPLHVQHIQVNPAIVIRVQGRRVTTPRFVGNPQLRRNFPKAILPLVVIQQTGLRPLRVQVPHKGVFVPHVIRVALAPRGCFGPATAAHLLGGEPPHIRDEQIEPPVAVIVEKLGRRRMPDISQPRLLGRVLEIPLPVVQKQQVPPAGAGHKQVGIAVVVGVGERSRNHHSIVNPHPRPLGDLLKPPLPHIPPQLTAPRLPQQEQIGPPIRVDVGGDQPRAMVVVIHLPVPGRIPHHPIPKRNPRFPPPVGELEPMLDRPLVGPRPLLFRPLLQPRGEEGLARQHHVRHLLFRIGGLLQHIPQINRQLPHVPVIATVVKTPHPARRIDQHKLRTVRDRPPVVRTVQHRQLEPLLAQLPDRLPLTGQKLPRTLVRPIAAGVVGQHRRSVKLRIDRDRHQPHPAPVGPASGLPLKIGELRRLHRAGRLAAGKDKVPHPRPPQQLPGSILGPGLIGQFKLGQRKQHPRSPCGRPGRRTPPRSPPLARRVRRLPLSRSSPRPLPRRWCL